MHRYRIITESLIFDKKQGTMKLVRRQQTIFEYVLVFSFVTMTTFIIFSVFLFGGQGNDKTFSGALMRLHDDIVSVISAPVP